MGGHDTYMHKEISEQADAVDRVLRGRIDDRFSTVHLGGLNLDAREARGVRRIKILGCGTSYHAGLIGAQLIEELARIPADAEPASEFRYRNPVVDPDTLYVAVSQSGETYDVLAAVQELKRKGARVLGVVNVVGSAIAREATAACTSTRAPRSAWCRRRLHQHGGGLREAIDLPSCWSTRSLRLQAAQRLAQFHAAADQVVDAQLRHRTGDLIDRPVSERNACRARNRPSGRSPPAT